MKIAISTDGKSVTSNLDSRFGRCEFFQIVDETGTQLKVVENQGNLAGGGAGIAAAQQIIDEEVDVIITGNLGPNAYNIINKSGIKAFKCESLNIEAVLKIFNNKELEEVSYPGPSHMGMSR